MHLNPPDVGQIKLLHHCEERPRCHGEPGGAKAVEIGDVQGTWRYVSGTFQGEEVRAVED